jgi:hypothetical protein
MKSSQLGVLLGILLGATAINASAQLFTAGDLLVSTYGNAGTAGSSGTYADGVPTPISLTEFTTSGQSVMAYTLPTTDSGNNLGIVGEFGSSSEGTIQLSGDGRYLTIGGYSATPSYAGAGGPAGGYSNANGVALAQSPSSAVPRVIALIDANGNVNSSTSFNNLYSTNNPRSAYTPDGSTLYISGQGSGASDQGIYRTTVGATNTATTVYNTLDTRTVSGYGGNLYYSVDKKNKSTGIFQYTGLPNGLATATQIIPGSNGLNGSSKVNYSPEGFFFANANTLYVADTGLPKNGGTSDGGIQKWTFNGTNWNLNYTLQDANFVSNSATSTATHGETGFEAITGQVNNGIVSLYAVSYTAGDADPNGFYAINDVLSATTYAGQTFTELAASNGNFTYKGVTFAPIPEPSAYAALMGCFVLMGGMVRRRFAT